MADRDTFNEFINELIDKNDILEVVRGYVDLTRKGNSYWGCCPFHHEKTASFHVEERLKIYKCFGCGAAGNVIKFIQEIESVSFMEACKILADRVGMKVPQFSHRKDDNLEEKKEKQERHLKLVATAARYYNNELMHNENVLEFLRSHGIDRKTIIAYGLGYSPNYYGVINHLMHLGYKEAEIDEAGVGYTTENDKFQDVMAGRIICPHINTFGKVAGFAGSLRNGNTIYTKNTDIFRAENEVFGTHLLKSIKMEEGIDGLIITSTPINAVGMRAKGYKKVVSTMGDNINSRQARALMRYTDKFTIYFGDVENGLDKTYSGIDALVEEGAGCKVATLVEHVNVLDTIERNTFGRLIGRMKNAKSLLEYQLRHIAKNYDLETDSGKNDYIVKAKEYIMTIKERSKQEPYISVLAKIASVPEDSIRKVFYQDAKEAVKTTTTKRVTGKKGKAYNAAMTVLGLINAGYTLDEDIDDLLEDQYKALYLLLRDKKEVNLSEYLTDNEIEKMKDADIEDVHNNKIIDDCLKILRQDKKKREQDAIIEEIDRETDIKKKDALLKKLNELVAR